MIIYVGVAVAVLAAVVVAAVLGPVLRRLRVPADDPPPDFAALATRPFVGLVSVAVLGVGLVGAFSTRPLLCLPLSLALVPACAIDLRTTYLPLRLTQAGWLLAAVAVATTAALERDPGVLARGAAGAILAGAVFWLAWRLHMLGFGDVRLMISVGAVTAAVGWRTFVAAVLAGTVLGALAGLVQLARGQRGLFPYGPSLLAGSLVAMALAGVS